MFRSQAMRMTFSRAAVAAAVVLAVGTAYITGVGRPQSNGAQPPPAVTLAPTASPTPEATALPSGALTPPFAGLIDLADDEARTGMYTVADRMLTSRSFGLPVRFWLDTFGDEPSHASAPFQSDWCAGSTRPGLIVLPWAVMCEIKLQVIHPASIDCGLDASPTADRLVAALLANPTLGIQDLGDVAGNPEVAPGTFVSPSGRFLRIPGRAQTFDIVDPDRCTIGAADTTIEIRGDIPQDLVVLDVGGEVVILRLAVADDGEAASRVPQPYLNLLRGQGGDAARGFGFGTIHDLSFK
jgi:hypothetical protein